MSKQRSHKDDLDQLLTHVLEELQATPDQEILGSESEEAVKQRALSRLQRARSAAGSQRLADAKRLLTTKPSSSPAATESADVARAYIRKISNDGRYTLAARQLEEMTDDDILSLYAQLQELEQKKPEE